MATSFRSLDLFSGLGGNAFAFRGIATPALYCECDEEAAAILTSAMKRGHIAAAPVHPDVRTLLESPVYRAASAQHPLLVSGSWPCQGNSTAGKRKGMEDARSGLVVNMCDVVLDSLPELVFFENTPLAATNGSWEYVVERLSHAYTLRWMLLPASHLGFPHQRKRFFALAVRTDWALPALDFGPDGRPDERQPPRTSPARGAASRLSALGNAVVPACSRLAMRVMYEDARAQPGGPARQLLITAADAPSVGGPTLLDPGVRAAVCGRKLSPAHTTPALTVPRALRRWATPRRSCWYRNNVLTLRGAGDLCTQVLFEVNTVNREDPVNVEWVEWLMGYPAGYTALC